MTEQSIAFWLKEYDATTDTLAHRGHATIRTERRTSRGTVVEKHASTEQLQKAADRGRQIATYLNSQQPRMTDAERRAYFSSVARHGQALLRHTRDKGEREQVEAMIAVVRGALGQ